MNYPALFGALIFATVLSLATASESGPAPKGWLLTGSMPGSYDIGTSPQGGQNRGPAGFLKSKAESAGFGTLMQMVQADEYRGRRVRFAATVRTENVVKWSGIWLRVDGPRREDGKSASLAFDNMQNRPIVGTTGWQRHEVVLDVPPSATALAYGLLINGTGAAWLDEVRLEVVSASVPTTAMQVGPQLLKKPSNLGFVE